MVGSLILRRGGGCLALALAALHLAAAPGRAQRPGPPTTRLSPAAATAAVRPAFRSVLGQPLVKAAVRTEILRQLRHNRPIALTGAGWAIPIDLGLAYALPPVRSALTSVLGANGGITIDGAILDPGRIAISFSPQQLGSLILGDIVKDIGGSFAKGALQNKMTGVVGADDVMIIMLVYGGLFLVGAEIGLWWQGSGSAAPSSGWDPNSFDPNADPDGDGKVNGVDDDDDGDGVKDEEDYYPDDKNGRSAIAADGAESSTAGTLPRKWSTPSSRRSTWRRRSCATRSRSVPCRRGKPRAFGS